MNYKDLAFINKVKTNQKEFGERVIDISNKLNIPANGLMITMNNETAGTFSPTIKNPTSSATGLIQLMKATYEDLGVSESVLMAMNNVQQLSVVYKYLKPYKGKMKTAADVYLAVFFPLALFRSDNWSFPEWAVKANPIFDLNGDGKLTKSEFINYVNKRYAKYIPSKKQLKKKDLEIQFQKKV